MVEVKGPVLAGLLTMRASLLAGFLLAGGVVGLVAGKEIERSRWEEHKPRSVYNQQERVDMFNRGDGMPGVFDDIVNRARMSPGFANEKLDVLRKLAINGGYGTEDSM